MHRRDRTDRALPVEHYSAAVNMRALRKGQARHFALEGGIVGEARLVERAFGLGPCALTVAVALLQDRLDNAGT